MLQCPGRPVYWIVEVGLIASINTVDHKELSERFSSTCLKIRELIPHGIKGFVTPTKSFF